MLGPVDPIPASTKSESWQDIERGIEHPEDIQQHYFHSNQSNNHLHQQVKKS